MNITHACLILCLTLTSILSGQKTESYIICFQDGQVPSKELMVQDYGVVQMKCLSPTLDVYKVDLPRDDHKTARISRLQSRAGVRYLHEDYVAYSRLDPNDPDYIAQWSFPLIGIDDVWDITTGGQNIAGHDIVVGVLDDGFMADHPDLEGRIWQNPEEIPNNDIDDDGNGYVDDVMGYNFDTEDDEHLVLSHGTNVLGVLGANGNNEQDVAGIDWSAKYMLLSSGVPNRFATSDVIRAYQYIYDQRKLYNDTQGQRGTYVVATNYSGGLDGVFAEDSPGWCEVLDQLGQVGVINIGSTSNQNVDVGAVGDVPGTCPTDHLISVTNTGRLNEKVENAGYSSIHVDLGAPGNLIMTLARGGGTRPDFMGTSAAAPHVAGVVSLMYSLMCEEGYELSLTRPEVMSRFVKQTIMETVRSSSDLAGITVSGGVIDALAAIESFDETYGDCCRILLDSLAYTDESCIDGGDATLTLASTSRDLSGTAIYAVSTAAGERANTTGDFSRLNGGLTEITIYDDGDQQGCRVDTTITIPTIDGECPFGQFQIQQVRTGIDHPRVVIDYELDEQKTITFQVFNNAGQLMYHQQEYPTLNTARQHEIDVSGWTSGIYHASIISNGIRTNAEAFLVVRR